MPPPAKTSSPAGPNRGAAADDAMQAAGITEWAAKGVVGFERIRRLAQNRTTLAKQASGIGKGVGKVAGPLGVALEVGNTAWLAMDQDKRSRVEADFDAEATAPAAERMVTGALNATDTLYAAGKAVYDTGKTYESIERSQMDEINNSLLRKIQKHEAELAKPPPPAVPTSVKGSLPLGQNPLAEAWMRTRAAQQREQQTDLALSARAKDSLAAVLTTPRLGGRSPLRLNSGRHFASAL